VSQAGRVFVVGLGPGTRDLLTPQALEAVRRSAVVVGYTGYFPWVADLVAGKECLALPLTQERQRARLAVEHAQGGQDTCVISSGDAGVYGMASLVLEALEECAAEAEPELIVVPGVSAVNACAALLGAPLGHDFAVISLSDLLTPWPLIEKRLQAAAGADFVLALLNPKSQRRDWQYGRARAILLEHRRPDTPVGIVRNAYRPGQSVTLTTLDDMAATDVDMFTTVIVGNSSTRRFQNVLVTPRSHAGGASP
jgi:precorrin-3B C17-methyltransferase